MSEYPWDKQEQTDPEIAPAENQERDTASSPVEPSIENQDAPVGDEPSRNQTKKPWEEAQGETTPPVVTVEEKAEESKAVESAMPEPSKEGAESPAEPTPTQTVPGDSQFPDGDIPAPEWGAPPDPQKEETKASEEPHSSGEQSPPPPYTAPPGGWGPPPYADQAPYGGYPPPYAGGTPPWAPGNGGQPYYPYTPYPSGSPYPGGMPPQKPNNKGAKVFIGILIGLSALFVVGFAVWGIFLSVEENRPKDIPDVTSRPSQSQTGDNENSTRPTPKPGASQTNPVGTATNPQYAGLTLAAPAATQLEPRDIYSKIEPAIVGVVSEIQDETSGEWGSATASGIIVTADGYIVTNAHVVGYSRTNTTKVVLNDKKEYEAVIVGYDRSSDLAVLKIEAAGLTPAVFGSSDALSVGDWVFAIGNPRSLDFSGTLTRGIVSALNRSVTYNATSMTYIQTDAAINPGNSGGALVNMYGQVVGINSAKINLSNYEGMGFSIPTSKAKTIIDDLIRQGYVGGRTRLGITGMSITASQASSYGVPQGVLIATISDDSPLAGTDAEEGDVITAIDGETIESMEDVYSVLYNHKPGDTLSLTLYRENSNRNTDTIEVKITLLEDKGETQN